MKGYFSQLARHTGLNLEVGSAISLSGSRTAPARPRAYDGVSPLHVEEVVFTSPSQSTGETSDRTTEGIVEHRNIAPISEKGSGGTSEGPAGSGEVRISEFSEPGSENELTTPLTRIAFSPNVSFEESTTHPASSRLGASESHASSDDKDSAAKPDRVPAHEPSRVIEQRGFVISEESFSAATPDSKEPLEIVAAFEDQYATPESQLAAPLDQNQQTRLVDAEGDGSMQAIKADTRSDASPEVEMDRQVMVRNYLKEVRDWIAAPSEMEEAEFEFRTAEETQPEGRNRAALGRGAPTAAPTARHNFEEPELQDLSLSIGTISIVIEEPRQEVLVQPAPPARPERVVDRNTSESIDLSRYYLRNW